MSQDRPDPETLEAAEKALRFLFEKPHDLRFRRDQITLDAAVFAFKALKKVDIASRASMGLFKLWKPVPVRKWSQIPKLFAKAAKKALDEPGVYKKSRVGATVVISHRRNLQYHLDHPDTFPCPDFR